MKITSHYIAGVIQDPTGSESLPKFNPAIGDEICQVPIATKIEVDYAVGSAKHGQKQWAKLGAVERGRILMSAARLLRESGGGLAELECLDTGKPISETRGVDIPSAADAIEYFAGIAASLGGQHFDLPSAFVYTRREPLGVCAGIGAWNYPLQIAAWKSAPCLAFGNSMVFKPSELTPTTAVCLAEIYSRAGVPDGVFNVVQGDASTGSALARHCDIAKVSFTGSVATGRTVMADAAATLKNVTMELGGKSPLILFGDCDFEEAVSAALMANFFTQGEICSNGTRVFVHESIHEKFLEKIVERVLRMKTGDPFDPDTQVGALISQKHLNRVLGYVQSGKNEGARLLCGGEPPLWPENRKRFRDGFFILPAVFSDCRDEMTIVREEIFGPVMSVLSFTDEDEVISRANATEFGLAAGVFTKDLQRGHRVVAQLEAGTCWINNYNITPMAMPFGGYKQSGIGRENGLAAVDHYTQIKSVYVEMGKVDCPF